MKNGSAPAEDPDPSVGERVHRVACLIVGRNLGDAVMTASFARTLLSSGRIERLIVWTVPQARFLFEGLDGCDVVVSAFPMGATVRSFVMGGWRSFGTAIRNIRRLHPTLGIELIGDVRERCIVRLLGAERVLGPSWAPGHPFRRHIRGPDLFARPSVQIPASTPNVYAAHRLILARGLGLVPKAALSVPSAAADRPRLTIGFHPFASQSCKVWPNAAWQQLLLALASEGHRLVGFGAPSEREALGRMVPPELEHVQLVTVPLAELGSAMRGLDILIGLDSLAVHLAASIGIRGVVLVGPNDPSVFTPPGSSAVFAPGVCRFQPCHGKPRCIGRSFEYTCIKSIGMADVLSVVSGQAVPSGSPVRVYRADDASQT